jgi:hypothetical protein
VVQDSVMQLLPARRNSSSSGWQSFNAVCCEHRGERRDTRGRGGVKSNPDGTITYHCFNCQFKTSYVPGRPLSYKFKKFLGWLGANESLTHKLTIDAMRIRDLIDPGTVVEQEPEQEIKFLARSLPDQAKSFSNWAKFFASNDKDTIPKDLDSAIRFVQNRKIEFDKYDFYWTPDTAHKMDRRVIVPFTWKNEIIGYAARTFDEQVKPKYYSNYEPNYVFNIDLQHPKNKFVIVCEGPFDAMSLDGVAVLGDRISEVQCDIIEKLGKEVIVVPDFDRAGMNLVGDAQEFGWAVSFPIWAESCKDINEAVVKYGKLFVLRSILESKETSRLKIELKKKKFR